MSKIQPSHMPKYVKEYNKKYYESKAKINREIILCSCGKNITKFSLKFHLKSKYHVKHHEIYNDKKRNVFQAFRKHIIFKKKLDKLYKFHFNKSI